MTMGEAFVVHEDLMVERRVVEGYPLKVAIFPGVTGWRDLHELPMTEVLEYPMHAIRVDGRQVRAFVHPLIPLDDDWAVGRVTDAILRAMTGDAKTAQLIEATKRLLGELHIGDGRLVAPKAMQRHLSHIVSALEGMGVDPYSPSRWRKDGSMVEE